MQVSWEVGKPPNFRSQRTKALLGYLAAEQRPVSRDALAALIWPDEALSIGKTNLRKEVYNLQNILPGCWRTDDKTIQFLSNTSVRVDIHEAQRLAQAGKWSEAAEFIQGDFLEGIYLDDNLEFETWLLGERERHWQQAEQVLIESAKIDQQAGNYPSARHHLVRLLQIIPWHEKAHQQMIRLLAYEGKFSAALKQYEKCKTILADELDVSPSFTTTELIDRIKVAMSLPRHNLPSKATPFIGREEEIAILKRHLANPDCRLLTLTGVGGIGKTQLALEVARQIATDDFRLFLHGLAFISLAGLTVPNQLPSRIAASLKFTFQGQSPLEQQLLNYLQEKELLLILDNFEQLMPDTSLLAAILEEAPGVKLLVTSRERLTMRHEWLFEVGSLPYPTGFIEKWTEADELRFAAIRLFISCAHRIKPNISLNRYLQEVCRICRLVEGMPLAIEIAATWVNTLSLADIALEIERGRGMLETEAKDMPLRHRSMQAIFDTSWQRLELQEKKLLMACSCFRGGFTLNAVIAVSNGMHEQLKQLVNQSLLTYKVDTNRYLMHELIRYYSAKKSASNIQEQFQYQERHCYFFIDLLQGYKIQLKDHNSQVALKEFLVEIDNIRSAWDWAVSENYTDAIEKAFEGLFQAYFQLKWIEEGVKVFDDASKRFENKNKNLATRLQIRQAGLLLYSKPNTAIALLEKGSGLISELDFPIDIAYSYEIYGTIARLKGQLHEALDYLEKGLAIYHRVNDPWNIASILTKIGDCLYRIGDFDKARKSFLEAFNMHRRIGNKQGMALALNGLGFLLNYLGDVELAEILIKESINLYDAIDNRYAIAVSIHNQGANSLARKDYLKARSYFEESLSVFQELNTPFTLSASLSGLGIVNYELGNFHQGNNYLFKALELSYSKGYMPVLLEVLVQTASIAKAEGRYELAVEIITFCLNHPALDAGETLNLAKNIWEEVSIFVPTETIQSISHLAEENSLSDIIEDAKILLLRQ